MEDYLFGEVRRNFQKRKFLLPDEFFCVVIWKSNRAKTSIKKKLLKFGDLKSTIKTMTGQIYTANGSRERLKILLRDWKFNLPMATAILTVLYPNEFTIKDTRVLSQLKMEDFNGLKKYFEEFLPNVKKSSAQKNLRDKDRELWSKSFHEDLIQFLNKEA